MASSSFCTLFRHKASGKQIVCKPISIETKSNWTFQSAAFGWTTESICSATVLSLTTCGHRLLLVGVDLKGPRHWYCYFSPSSLITSLWTCKLPVSSRPQSCVHVLLEVCRTGRNLQHPSTGETIQARGSIGTTLPLKTGTVLTDWAGWMGFSAMHQQSLHGRHARRQETAAICHFFW
jgi:hypothetical protein